MSDVVTLLMLQAHAAMLEIDMREMQARATRTADPCDEAAFYRASAGWLPVKRAIDAMVSAAGWPPANLELLDSSGWSSSTN